MDRLRKRNRHVVRPTFLYSKVRDNEVMHLDVMSGQVPSSSRFSDDELSGWLDEPVVMTPTDDGGACMQDVISHSPWIWQMSPADMHPSGSLWTDNGESSRSLSPASAAPSAFQIPQQRESTPELRKAHSLPVPRRNRATAAERRRYIFLSSVSDGSSTRGPNVNPTKGNNKQGRLGKLRCLLCRSQHHKVLTHRRWLMAV